MAIKYTVHTIPDGFGSTYDAVIETGKCGNFPLESGNSEYEKFLKDVKTEGITTKSTLRGWQRVIQPKLLIS